ncbi:GNAT acetyltransferase 2-domain-containing protein, partial [Baffinella frigidus]
QMKKKVDARVRALIEASVASNHRGLMVLVGDKGRHQVVNLHYMLSKSSVKARPSVLWCYKRELGFSSHKTKRMKQLKKMANRSGTDLDKMQDPFELFISSTQIRYCYYHDTHKILGNTFGMVVLQDFEALTPNLLARTIETVEGGGLVLILLKTMDSLRQLYSMTMDVHARFRTESSGAVVARFNERFLLSLGTCGSALVLDDELNVLPISSSSRGMLQVLKPIQTKLRLKPIQTKLRLKPIQTLEKQAEAGPVAKALLTFMEAVSDKTLRSTVAMTAGRGRGKSAVLGMSIAGAIAYGYSNIFVSSPTPENLNTLFEFVLKGFDALEYKEHLDYQVIQSSNPAFNGATVRINVFHSHRQTVQYVAPEHSHLLAQAELVVVDEAAAIPLPLVKKMFGPYLLFLSSTINGYEGTGRSLSLKLIEQLRVQQSRSARALFLAEVGRVCTVNPAWQLKNSPPARAMRTGRSSGGRLLREIRLEVPIRYSSNDPVEKWLHKLLCLDATAVTPTLKGGCPSPDKCELYYVERDTLFSHHKAAEDFLQGMMSLYVASHYKNSPNDLLLLSDAPAHQDGGASSPDILCGIQVCLEGEISRETVVSQLAKGVRSSGDLIPWTIAQQFQDSDFAALSGARIVRIATHPEVNLETLNPNLEPQNPNPTSKPQTLSAALHSVRISSGRVFSENTILKEKLSARKGLPPLLVPIGSRRPEPLHYIGVSYGITAELYRFWKRAGFLCTYVRQVASDITGEHTAICLKPLDAVAGSNTDWLPKLHADFRRRFASLIGFSSLTPDSIEITTQNTKHKTQNPDPKPAPSGGGEQSVSLTAEELEENFSDYDIRRLESYADSIADHHLVVDLVPALARLFFLDRLPAAVLLGMGLQHRTIDALEVELKLEGRQLLANFNKTIVR